MLSIYSPDVLGVDCVVLQTMSSLQRPLTINFSTRSLGKITEVDVIQAVREQTQLTNVKAVQLTHDECRLTLVNEAARDELQRTGLKIKNREMILTSSDLNINKSDHKRRSS